MSVWAKLSVSKTGGGVWQRLAEDLAQTPASAGSGIWGQIAAQPGGVWSQARHETLVLTGHGSRRCDLWQEANDETLVLVRTPKTSLWDAVTIDAIRAELSPTSGGSIPAREEADLWAEAANETLVLSRAVVPVWQLPNSRDLSHIRPVRAPGWALKQLTTAHGEEYYVLKNLRTLAYLKLDPKQKFLWDRMDGSQSIQDLAVAMFIQYQTLSIEWLVGFVGLLKLKGFLAQESLNVYRGMDSVVARRTVSYWIKRAVNFLLYAEFAFKNVDDLLGKIYRRVQWLIFGVPAQLIFLIIAVAGLPAYFIVTNRGDVALLATSSGGQLTLGLVGLYIAQVFAILSHELSHALTTKHFGRQIRRAGTGLYYGMVTFFVDTTDIWMERRSRRLLVTWAGPYSGFILGGLANLILLMGPPAALAGPLYQFGSYCYVVSVLNLNPLLKLDGYYILMDWLEMPMLREQSMAFVRHELWTKLRQRERFGRKDAIYAIFGSLSVIWTAFVLLSIVRLFGGKILGVMTGLFGSNAIWIAAVTVGVLILLTLRWRLKGRVMPA